MAKQRKKELSNAVRPGSAKKLGILRNMNCEELARRSQQGCRASFAELVERYGLRLFRFLRSKTDNPQDTEDLVQDTFVKAYENIHRYKDSWKFSTWLFTIAARLAYSHFRRSRSFQTVEDIELNDTEPVQMLAEKETQKNLWALARDLSVNQYHALWLKYQQGMSIKEIALVLRKSQVNVKVLLYRARINLAKKLQEVSVDNELVVQMSPKEILAFMKVEGA
jgi:RNA polymerase sigma-70 factor (ECF subfamily)